MEDKKLYILEKIWHVKSKNFVLDKDKYDEVLVRPCNVGYRTYRNFSLGKKTHAKCIVHEGCIATWNTSNPSWSLDRSSKTFEEFMIYVNVNKQAFPLIENWVLNINWKSYTGKTIDLKTGEVLYDQLNLVLSEHMKWNLI